MLRRTTSRTAGLRRTAEAVRTGGATPPSVRRDHGPEPAPVDRDGPVWIPDGDPVPDGMVPTTGPQGQPHDQLEP